MRSSVRALLAVGAAVLLGCSAPADASGPGAGEFPADPLATLASASGALSLAVRTSPSQPPTRGTSAVELTVTDAKGAALAGLDVAVEPWMPAMGHGASVVPTVSEEGGGRYVAREVDLFMPGRWELRTTFSGSVSDHATVVFDIP
jgi:hypothetical protein